LHPDQFQLEWLDESNDEQVFTLEDMKEAFRCGYARGSELQTLGVQGEYFPEFIKRNYNIDL
jgi:hypothetical protein